MITAYNAAAGSFHTKKLRSRLFAYVQYYSQIRFLSHPMGAVMGKVHTSSMARWKARG